MRLLVGPTAPVTAIALMLGWLGPASRAVDLPAGAAPPPLSIAQAVALAREHRAEIPAARARALAAQQRPDIVSALEDPMFSSCCAMPARHSQLRDPPTIFDPANARP